MENQPSPPSWARNLRREREQRAWTQEEVARRLKTDVRTVRHWESGDHRPGPEYRRRLAELYQRSVADLGFVEEERVELPQPGTPSENAHVNPTLGRRQGYRQFMSWRLGVGIAIIILALMVASIVWLIVSRGMATQYGMVTKQSTPYASDRNGRDMYYTELKFNMDTGQWWGSAHYGEDRPTRNTLYLWQCKINGTNCSVKHSTNEYSFSSDELGVDTSMGWAYMVCGSADFHDRNSAKNYCTDLIGYPIRTSYFLADHLWNAEPLIRPSAMERLPRGNVRSSTTSIVGRSRLMPTVLSPPAWTRAW